MLTDASQVALCPHGVVDDVCWPCSFAGLEKRLGDLERRSANQPDLETELKELANLLWDAGVKLKDVAISLQMTPQGQKAQALMDTAKACIKAAEPWVSRG